MSRTKRDEVARKRGELSHGGVARSLAPAIKARRRLNALRRGTGETGADHFGPRDRGYEYLTRSHD